MAGFLFIVFVDAAVIFAVVVDGNVVAVVVVIGVIVVAAGIVVFCTLLKFNFVKSNGSTKQNKFCGLL